jgi:hypothetical protein
VRCHLPNFDHSFHDPLGVKSSTSHDQGEAIPQTGYDAAQKRRHVSEQHWHDQAVVLQRQTYADITANKLFAKRRFASRHISLTAQLILIKFD